MENIAQKTAEYCEQIFNSKEFQNLFTGDFITDEIIYKAVGGAIL